MSNLKSSKKISLIQLVPTVLLVISLVFGGYYFKQYNDLKSKSSKTAEQANKELVEKVGKVYQLPGGEDPVVLNVNKDPGEFTTDQEKAFAKTFKDLKKDDVILLYQKAGLAIEWRNSENKVIATAPLAVAATTNIGIIASADVQNQLSDILTKKLPDDVKVGGKALPVGQFATTTVIDVTGTKPDVAKKVADAVGGTVATAFPVGEKTPEGAEIVIISGPLAASVTTP